MKTVYKARYECRGVRTFLDSMADIILSCTHLTKLPVQILSGAGTAGCLLKLGTDEL
jgi:hypothetical protein